MSDTQDFTPKDIKRALDRRRVHLSRARRDRGRAMPPALLFLILLVNDREIVGVHVNGRLGNTVAIAITVFLLHKTDTTRYITAQC